MEYPEPEEVLLMAVIGIQELNFPVSDHTQAVDQSLNWYPVQSKDLLFECIWTGFSALCAYASKCAAASWSLRLCLFVLPIVSRNSIVIISRTIWFIIIIVANIIVILTRVFSKRLLNLNRKNLNSKEIPGAHNWIHVWIKYF